MLSPILEIPGGEKTCIASTYCLVELLNSQMIKKNTSVQLLNKFISRVKFFDKQSDAE